MSLPSSSMLLSVYTSYSATPFLSSRLLAPRLTLSTFFPMIEPVVKRSMPTTRFFQLSSSIPENANLGLKPSTDTLYFDGVLPLAASDNRLPPSRLTPFTSLSSLTYMAGEIEM